MERQVTQLWTSEERREFFFHFFFFLRNPRIWGNEGRPEMKPTLWIYRKFSVAVTVREHPRRVTLPHRFSLCFVRSCPVPGRLLEVVESQDPCHLRRLGPTSGSKITHNTVTQPRLNPHNLINTYFTLDFTFFLEIDWLEITLQLQLIISVTLCRLFISLVYRTLVGKKNKLGYISRKKVLRCKKKIDVRTLKIELRSNFFFYRLSRRWYNAFLKSKNWNGCIETMKSLRVQELRHR